MKHHAEFMVIQWNSGKSNHLVEAGSLMSVWQTLILTGRPLQIVLGGNLIEFLEYMANIRNNSPILYVDFWLKWGVNNWEFIVSKQNLITEVPQK